MPSEYAKQLCKDFVRVYKFEEPIIDVGAGAVSYWYKPFFLNKEFYTMDSDPQFVHTCDYGYDICNLPNDFKNKFGVVLLLETLEHMPNPFCAFKNIFRMLKPGGYLLCSTVSCYPIHRHPIDCWRFLPDGLEILMAQAGFISKGTRLSQPNAAKTAHIFCVAQKPPLKNAN